MTMTLRPLAAFAGMAALVLGGVGSAQAQGTPKRGGTAVIGVSVGRRHAQHAAHLGGDAADHRRPVGCGLFKYDRTGGKKPQLASSWDISADGKVYTFHLRPNLKWSDGQPFSSSRRRLHAECLRQVQHLSGEAAAEHRSRRDADANTFVIHLKAPQSALLEGFDKEIFPVMPKHVYDGKDIPSNEANRAPVGMGPYKFVKWEEGRGITFTRNENYWDQPKPYLDSVVAVFIPAVQQQQNALYRGEIDVLRPALPQIGRTIEQAKAKTPSRCARSRSTPPSGCRSTSTPRARSSTSRWSARRCWWRSIASAFRRTSIRGSPSRR
jgi:peptide/nickel transport system substrate-binding protein